MLRRRRAPRGRVLAVKLGLNPNSSSLGADVTYLLAGAAVLSFITPVLSALLRGFVRGRSHDVPATPAEPGPPAE